MPTTVKTEEVVLTVGIDPELRHRVRVAALIESKSLKDAVTEALSEWLQGREGQSPTGRAGAALGAPVGGRTSRPRQR